MLGWKLTAGVPNREALQDQISFGSEHRLVYRFSKITRILHASFIGCPINSRHRKDKRTRLRATFSQPCIEEEKSQTFDPLHGGVNYYSNLSSRIDAPTIQGGIISDLNNAAFNSLLDCKGM
jgi:hypothetical protein